MKKMKLKLAMGSALLLTTGLILSFTTNPIKKNKTKKYKVIRCKNGKTTTNDTIIYNSNDYSPQDYLDELGYANDEHITVINLSETESHVTSTLQKREQNKSTSKKLSDSMHVSVHIKEKGEDLTDLHKVLSEFENEQQSGNVKLFRVGSEEMDINQLISKFDDSLGVIIKKIIIKDSLSDTASISNFLEEDVTSVTANNIKVIKIDDKEIDIDQFISKFDDSEGTIIKKVVIKDSLSDTDEIASLLKDFDMTNQVKVIKINDDKVTVNSDNTTEDFTVIIVSNLTNEKEKSLKNVNQKSQNSSLIIYPNPSSGVALLKLNFIDTAKTTIQVLDIKGKIVHQANLGKIKGIYNHELNAKSWPSGVYIVNIKHGTELVQDKFIVE